MEVCSFKMSLLFDYVTESLNVGSYSFRPLFKLKVSATVRTVGHGRYSLTSEAQKKKEKKLCQQYCTVLFLFANTNYRQLFANTNYNKIYKSNDLCKHVCTRKKNKKHTVIYIFLFSELQMFQHFLGSAP